MSSRKQRILAVVLIAIAVVGAAVGAAFGYLSAKTGEVENTFIPDQETRPAILETFKDNTKSNVKVDVGDPGYAVYVRAAIVVTWEDEKGNVLPQVPQPGVDYSITLRTGADDPWFQHTDSFYYHKRMVNSGEDTEVLINECKPLKAAPQSGYTLHVEIIAQTIQALGTTDATDGTYPSGKPAVTDAWGIPVSNGQLVDPNP